MGRNEATYGDRGPVGAGGGAGRAGSCDLVVGGTGESVAPVPKSVFRRARELELEVAGVEVDAATGRPQAGFDLVEPPERADVE
ncbi:hypothetical protein BRC89_04060 [Halobacteriales archaeon QS_4_70_19]|nr:MAG: hypothetical protein BRC89_04060 [Halobacteriales archaeon QS_4_70_19]